MNKNLPLVSVIVPCRNEERYIKDCLSSILEQDYPRERMEILIVDGMSQDKTRQFLKEYQERYSFIRVLDNPKRVTPSALNIGIKNSKGDVIVLFGAHAIYEKNYISKCVKYLEEYGADNVGGTMLTLPANNSFLAKAIAISLSHSFGVGNSHFRTAAKKPRLVDTVFGGCYKREVFKKIGFFNENLVRGQDMEFNLRLKRANGKILLLPDIISHYYPKSSLKDFLVRNFKNGFWQVYEFKFTKKLFCLRHYIPLLFVLNLLGSIIMAVFFPPFLLLFLLTIGIYFLFTFYVSLRIAVDRKKWQYLFLMPVVFICRHFPHGLGSLAAFVKIMYFYIKKCFFMVR